MRGVNRFGVDDFWRVEGFPCETSGGPHKAPQKRWVWVGVPPCGGSPTFHELRVSRARSRIGVDDFWRVEGFPFKYVWWSPQTWCSPRGLPKAVGLRWASPLWGSTTFGKVRANRKYSDLAGPPSRRTVLASLGRKTSVFNSGHNRK